MPDQKNEDRERKLLFEAAVSGRPTSRVFGSAEGFVEPLEVSDIAAATSALGCALYGRSTDDLTVTVGTGVAFEGLTDALSAAHKGLQGMNPAAESMAAAHKALQGINSAAESMAAAHKALQGINPAAELMAGARDAVKGASRAAESAGAIRNASGVSTAIGKQSEAIAMSRRVGTRDRSFAGAEAGGGSEANEE